MFANTIAAIATPKGTGGVGIIRISGDNSIEIAEKMFIGAAVSQMKSHTMHLGKIKHGQSIIDEALICVFRAPNSYTGEDVVEINCHGGSGVCKLVLDSALKCGAHLASAGEFTRRAFLNGRLDLSQAEAVGDIIDANTADAVKQSANQLSGKLTARIDEIRNNIIATSAHLLAILDYPEEGVEDLPYDTLKVDLHEAKSKIDLLLSTADDGRIIMDGINAAIIGAPNVGKSSLLNAISGEDRAIVTDVAGTTRDVLEASVNIRGCKVNLLDTAGIRESSDIVEQIGVERSKSALEKADVVLLVLDGSRELTPEDYEIIAMAKNNQTICIVNKCDLPQRLTLPDGFSDVAYVSAKSGTGMDNLFGIISSKYSKGELVEKEVILTNQRHVQALLHAGNHIDSAISAMVAYAPVDMVLGDIELAISSLGEISGASVSEDIIDSIFANFCVGK